MVSLKRHNLDRPSLAAHFARLSEIRLEPIEKNGRLVAYLYWRVGYDYGRVTPEP